MIKSLTYKSAINKLAFISDKANVKLNMFDVSLIVAVLYDVNKEKALDDLIKARREIRNRK